ITPKMSFGTGHHATTFLVIQQMSALNFKDKSVIDFGTGTGVLAILAEKMGAASILAIDNDERSINNSEENIAANGCDKIDLRLANEMIFEEKADIILANINLNVIIDNIRKIKDAVKNNGSVLLSGLLVVDEETIKEVLKTNNFDIEKITNKNGWISVLVKPGVFPPTLN
ncbi:MAG: 50S ribosomal protein L11 methyltransferase, partial [Rhizobacter sp.]|nr:50S ribosomal protein L11 methyltransferase [Ferruginibacter sp.]